MPIKNRDEYYMNIRRGLVDGHEIVHKFGANDVVGTTFEHIWHKGSLLDFQTLGSAYDITSSTSLDASGQVGARILMVEGLLAADWTTFVETVVLDGLLGVTTVNTFIRLQRMYVTDCGTYGGTNAGSISAQTSGGDVQATIKVNEGQSQKSQYTVPDGKIGHIIHFGIDVEATKTGNIKLYRRNDSDEVAAPFTAKRIMHEWNGITGHISDFFIGAHIVSARGDIWFEGKVGTGSGEITADYDVLLIDTP